MTTPYETFDPFAELPDNDGDYAANLNRAGWEEFLSIGDDRSVLYITSWRRTKQDSETEYMLDVWDVNCGSPFIKVGSFPDLMDLLARWAPAVQAATMVHLVDGVLEGGLSSSGVIEQVAARASFGAADALPVMRRQEAEQQRQRRLHREARRAAAGKDVAPAG